MTTENYTYKDEFGEIHTVTGIPSAEVDKVYANLKSMDSKATRLEALELWCFDNDKIGNAEADALTAKAKASGTMTRNSSGKKRKAPQRKPDMVKRALINDIVAHLQSGIVDDSLASCANCSNGVDNVNIDNVERIISFSIGEDSYTLTLAKKRKPKNS